MLPLQKSPPNKWVRPNLNLDLPSCHSSGDLCVPVVLHENFPLSTTPASPHWLVSETKSGLLHPLVVYTPGGQLPCCLRGKGIPRLWSVLPPHAKLWGSRLSPPTLPTTTKREVRTTVSVQRLSTCADNAENRRPACHVGWVVRRTADSLHPPTTYITFFFF